MFVKLGVSVKYVSVQLFTVVILIFFCATSLANAGSNDEYKLETYVNQRCQQKIFVQTRYWLSDIEFWVRVLVSAEQMIENYAEAGGVSEICSGQNMKNRAKCHAYHNSFLLWARNCNARARREITRLRNNN